MKKYFFNSVTLPSPLEEDAVKQWQLFEDACGRTGAECSAALGLRSEAMRVWPFSRFISSACIGWPRMLDMLAASGLLHSTCSEESFASRLAPALSGVSDDSSLASALREFRRSEMVRIAWRDISGAAALEETIRDLSLVAEACLNTSCTLIEGWLAEEFGAPCSPGGSASLPVVIAMGKLGARELNFSSDIDLVFAFSEPGETGGSGRSITNQEFFTRLFRRLMAVIGSCGPDGMVFRVDTRLRPWGDSGPVCMSFDAMEEYYETQGRDWERYAWIKARPVAGAIAAGDELLARLSPFVYRRYLDYSAFEALRDMKAMIESESRRRRLQDNVKLGAGGIREVEFIVQAFQLLLGGRDARLRNPVLLEVLPLLADLSILSGSVCRDLEDAYVFLRNTEHRLQEYMDRQTHVLPGAGSEQDLLALSLGFDAWEPFTHELRRHMDTVHTHFSALFMRSEEPETEAARQVWRFFASRIQRQADHAIDPELISLLGSLGFQDPEHAVILLEGLEESRPVRAMLPQGRRRLDDLMPVVIKKCSESPEPDRGLAIMTALIEAVARRTVYITMLQENPEAIDHLLKLCLQSTWLAGFISRNPVVLDELLDSRTLYDPPDRDELRHIVRMRMASIDRNDFEQQMDELRMLKRSAIMRVAAADITGAVPLMRVSDFLTWIAEVIVEEVLDLACSQMAEKVLDLRVDVQGAGEASGFLVVAYGKFGGIELGYGSDLDLVFACDASHARPPFPGREAMRFYSRTAQRFIHIFNSRTPAGILYETDMRLRPGGESGPLVCTLARLEEYLREEAWTWEHQALVRARPVAGSEELCREFGRIRQQVITRRRSRADLCQDVVAMRQRLVSRDENSLFDIKRGQGGITDIEFIVQFLVLLHACDVPELCRWTDNVRLLETLEEHAILSDDMASTLKEAYLRYRKTVHRLSLQERPAKVPAADFASERESVMAVWKEVMS